jgi:hypothetical protein
MFPSSLKTGTSAVAEVIKRQMAHAPLVIFDENMINA